MYWLDMHLLKEKRGGRIGIGIEIGVMVGKSSNDTRF